MNRDGSYYLLTGATGLLGQAVLRAAMLDDRPMAVIVRSRPEQTARRRLDAMIGRWEAELNRWLPRPVVLAGDLHQPNCDLDERAIAWIATHCSTVIHSAASLVFYAASNGEPWSTNVDGTRHLLELCRAAGIRHCFHVSTAYVSGQRTGRVLESELDVGQSLGNDYERSKLEAERLVRSAAHLKTTTILRPSIVVGDSRSGHTPTFHGFYRPLQVLFAPGGPAPGSAPQASHLAQLGLSGDERKNLVPVDWVSAMMWRIIDEPAAHGATYHLASDQPVTVRDIERATAEAIAQHAVAGRRAAGHVRAGENGAAATFADQLHAYRAYFRDDAQFDTSNLQRVAGNRICPRLTHEVLVRLARYALTVNFGWPRPADPSPPLEVEACLAELGLAWQAEPPASGLGLDALGPGGGRWQIGFVGDLPTTLTIGCPQAAGPTVRLDVETLDALIAGKLSTSAAIHAGRLLIETPADQTPATLAQWSVLLAHLSRAVPTAAGRTRPLATSKRTAIHAQ
ncbi:MAG TPA: SDR family oxidoreductase [Pirellulales bacterium]